MSEEKISLKDSLKKYLPHNAKIVIASAACVIFVSVCAVAWAVFSEQKDITVSINGKETSYTTFKHTVADFLSDENIVLEKNDSIDVPLNLELKDNQKLEIARSVDVDILVDGNTISVSDVHLTVAEALEQSGVTLAEADTVTPSLDSKLEDGMVVDVNRISVAEEVREMAISYAVERRNDASIDFNSEKVLQEGIPGNQIDSYLVTYSDGKIINEVLLNSKIVEPVTKVVAKGSRVLESQSRSQSSATYSLSSAEAIASINGNEIPADLKYTTTLTAKATAYTHDGSKTKSGTECRVGAIAVDPSVIPLGTKLYVEGYGYCTAEDTGGKIKGNRIDIFLNTEDECRTWGVKDVTVYILE